MRVSLDTLVLLGRLGDKEAESTAVWLDKNKGAEAHALKGGRLGAGWPGAGHFANHMGSLLGLRW